ncbi:MAG: hypothetical protein IPP71_19660 [Bacteroidetes bacterium]|nr:hypothetical protein [Bacteroidota bacterium]
MRIKLLFPFLMIITFFHEGYAQLAYKWHAAIKSPYSETCYAAGVDSVGNSFYLLKLSDIVVDVDPGPGQFLITHTNTAFALIKLDTNGVLQFAKKIECTVSTGDLRFWKLKPHRYGNII